MDEISWGFEKRKHSFPPLSSFPVMQFLAILFIASLTAAKPGGQKNASVTISTETANDCAGSWAWYDKVSQFPAKPIATQPLHPSQQGGPEFDKFCINHLSQAPLPPVEEHSRILETLQASENGFLYLDSSSEIDMLLQLPTRKLIGDGLIAYLGALLEGQEDQTDEYTLSNGSDVVFFSSDSPRCNSIKNPAVMFHKDTSRGQQFHLNFWIATADVHGYPLVFVKPNRAINPDLILDSWSDGLDQFLKVDPHQTYLMVPEMKAGQMLVFRGTHVFHGSVVLVDNPDGPRSSVAVAFGYD